MEASFKLKSLKETLAYKNENVIYRFTETFSISEKEAKGIFKDCLKWLWLCANAAYDRKIGIKNVPSKLAIDDSLLIIDEMWHNFLCFTKDYQAFCLKYFGVFIHHVPTTKAFNEELKEQMKMDISVQRKRRELQYSYILEKLGKDVISVWYNYYGVKYPKKKIIALRRK